MELQGCDDEFSPRGVDVELNSLDDLICRGRWNLVRKKKHLPNKRSPNKLTKNWWFGYGWFKILPHSCK